VSIPTTAGALSVRRCVEIYTTATQPEVSGTLLPEVKLSERLANIHPFIVWKVKLEPCPGRLIWCTAGWGIRFYENVPEAARFMFSSPLFGWCT
jgi:hypothetical protein